MKLFTSPACLFQSVLDVAYHQMLTPLYNPSPEPSGASAHGARCLSSEHAVIAKEQTAQAIANTARAYEKSGVEAALSKVRVTPGPRFGEAGFQQ